jgi:hypothetical protein
MEAALKPRAPAKNFRIEHVDASSSNQVSGQQQQQKKYDFCYE